MSLFRKKVRMSLVLVTAGLGFGDESKGSTIDYLARKHDAKLVVRYSGGAQCAHNVVLEDGRHHVFAQFGAATLIPGVRTHLSRFMIVNPLTMINEDWHLQELGVHDGLKRMTIDREALVTNPYQVSANRMREMLRSKSRHGSCGMGIGETMSDALEDASTALRVGDLSDATVVRAKLKRSRERKIQSLVRSVKHAGSDIPPAARREWDRLLESFKDLETLVETYVAFAEQMKIVDESFLVEELREGTTLFEGAQGVLLDQDFGFHPHTTWTSVTFANANTVLTESRSTAEVRRIGITRAHTSRHGAGPLPTFNPELVLKREHNAQGPWQGNFRVGHLDLVLLHYAAKAVGQLDEVVVSHLDCFEQDALFRRVCTAYKSLESWPRWPEGASNSAERLASQEANNTRLLSAEPVYADFSSVEELIAGVEESTKAPVRLRSYGPTAADKK